MRRAAGLGLKSVQWLLRLIEFLCSIIILAIFIYFIARLSHHNNGLFVPTWVRAVTGISGAGALYTLIGLLLLCCLAGIAFFSAIAMLLDVLFIGAFIYLAWELRRGRSCSGFVQTPFGDGNVDQNNRASQFNGLPSLRTSCRLETASFAVALVALVCFLFSILTELFIIRNRRKERAFGPSPANNYTSGRPRRGLWDRLRGRRGAAVLGAGALGVEKNPDSLPAHTTPSDVRQSYNSETTAVNTESGMLKGSTRLAADDNPSYQKYGRPVTPQNHPAYGTGAGTGAGYDGGYGTGGVGAGAGYAGYDYANRQDDTSYGRRSYAASGSGRETPPSGYVPYRPPSQVQQGGQQYGVTGGAGVNELEGNQVQSHYQPVYYSARANDASSPVSPVAEMDAGRRF